MIDPVRVPQRRNCRLVALQHILVCVKRTWLIQFWKDFFFNYRLVGQSLTVLGPFHTDVQRITCLVTFSSCVVCPCLRSCVGLSLVYSCLCVLLQYQLQQKQQLVKSSQEQKCRIDKGQTSESRFLLPLSRVNEILGRYVIGEKQTTRFLRG